MSSLFTALKIVRDLGPGWALKRLKLAAEVRLGIVGRELPFRDWEFRRADWAVLDGTRNCNSTAQALTKFFFFSEETSFARSIGNAVSHQADRLLSGEWPFFSRQWLQLGFPPDWHFNALAGTRLDDNCHWSEFALNAIDDVKFVWEPNRFSVAYLLARAYAGLGDERFPEAFWSLTEDWAEKNPPNRGVNWASGQEVALRMMAWCFALHAFVKSPSSTDDRVAKLLCMIETHGNRIAGFINYGLSQRNNHGIGEAVGLFTIGILFPEFQRSTEWLRLGRHLIQSQIHEQVYADGSYIQHSLNYQRVFIDYLVWALRLGELNNAPFSKESYQILGRAVHFMLPMCDPTTGRMPNYGSNDGSLVLPLSSCDFVDYRPSLQAAYFLVHHEFYFGKGEWDEQWEWLFARRSAQEARTRNGLPDVETQKTQSDSGYLKLVAAEGYAMLRAARYADRPSQADQLHLDLWWRGKNIVCDAGTYLYNGPSPWTNALATTSVHNTITVGNQDQMTRAGRFLWVDWAQADWREYEIGNSCGAIEAWHDGYSRIGAMHRRSIAYLQEKDIWIVVDDVCGSPARDVRLHWLFANYPYQWESNELRLALRTPVGEFQGSVYCSTPNITRLITGGEVCFSNASNVSEFNERIYGWRSQYYGCKEPAISLAVETQGTLPVRFVTVLAPSTSKLINIDDKFVEVEASNERFALSLLPVGSERICSRG
ncbi:MAG: hypothetical protein DMG64_04870 [Acidobacteria bacterium]|nr:MAG: hypothetical protein DMG64_04870 [Acidobacteriota bacterium]